MLHLNGNFIKFTECEYSLYLFDTAALENHRILEEPKHIGNN